HEDKNKMDEESSIFFLKSKDIVETVFNGRNFIACIRLEAKDLNHVHNMLALVSYFLRIQELCINRSIINTRVLDLAVKHAISFLLINYYICGLKLHPTTAQERANCIYCELIQ
ncbi:hypothetical protein ACJX0J_014752, partial [Zea mays]